MALHLEELLVREGRLTPDQAAFALERHRRTGDALPAVLLDGGFVTEDDITGAISRYSGVPAIDLRDFSIAPGVARLIPQPMAHRHVVLPVGRSTRVVTLAMVDPSNVLAIDDVKFATGLDVEPVVASERAINEAIASCYETDAGDDERAGPTAADLAMRVLEELGTGSDNLEVMGGAEEIDMVALEEQGGDAPIIKLVHALLLSAIQKGASDIHIEPYERDMRIRFRIDGRLHPVMAPPIGFRDAIIARVKIMARLDIAEKRLPQDGRIKTRFIDRGRTRALDFRVSVLPTLFGEKVVLRVLDPDALRLDMTQLGFEDGALQRFEQAIARPWGMVLVTGPTGSGKTSTLYASLTRLNAPGVNIVTVEDPVEFSLAGINQVPVREQIGLTFAAVLRSLLRQDPNIILVGEIRDSETAAIAVKAALTGHLVLSTLHTNDAPSTVDRLITMGVEPFLVANAVSLIAAQRLVRRTCPACRPGDESVSSAAETGYVSDSSVLARRPTRPRVCPGCSGSGFRGRVALFEVMSMSDRLRELVVGGAPAATLRQQAVDEGMFTLRQSGLEKVRQGITTLDEVMTETM
jgi:type IV pilus assembly protein PilB